jgi:hypothetical protein
MPPTGSNFTDWQQVEKESLLFSSDDFNWSEAPQRRRRRMTDSSSSARRGLSEEPIRAGRRVAVLEQYEPQRYEPQPGYHDEDYAGYDAVATAAGQEWDQPTATHSHFDEMMQEWNANYGAGASDDRHGSAERAFDLSDPGASATAAGGRRTVVITGHGDERYLPAPRRRRSSELRFHERSGFSPDRLGLWAVLLSLALVIGAIAH